MRSDVNKNTLIVYLEGEIDHHTAEDIREYIDREYQKKKTKHLLVDLSQIGFMDSSGIGLLIGRYKKCHLSGGKMALLNVSAPLERLLTLSGIPKIMPIYEDVEAALVNLG
jgi:stage II sporulation protein AA (anti-sigma F factor antagonist)